MRKNSLIALSLVAASSIIPGSTSTTSKVKTNFLGSKKLKKQIISGSPSSLIVTTNKGLKTISDKKTLKSITKKLKNGKRTSVVGSISLSDKGIISTNFDSSHKIKKSSSMSFKKLKKGKSLLAAFGTKNSNSTKLNVTSDKMTKKSLAAIGAIDAGSTSYFKV